MVRGRWEGVRWSIAAVLLGFATSCVPLSEYSVDGAPCPCPTGYRCCLGSCQKNALFCDALDSTFESDSRTTTYTTDTGTDSGAHPGSDTGTDMGTDTGTETETDSGTDTGTDTGIDTETDAPTDTIFEDTGAEPTSCETNDNCKGGEVCLSWLSTENRLMGPKVCRPTCYSSNECNVGEVCELSLSDGRPMEEHRLSLACLDSFGFEGCGPSSCRACASAIETGGTELETDVAIQTTICSENTNVLIGCFVALDATCGLYCTTEKLIQCDFCAVVDGRASCQDMIDGNYSDIWCAEYPCGTCEVAPGEASCVDSEKKICMSVPLTDDVCGGECVCDEICIEEDLGACP